VGRLCLLDVAIRDMHISLFFNKYHRIQVLIKKSYSHGWTISSSLDIPVGFIT
jgi:hypothetical protein